MHHFCPFLSRSESLIFAPCCYRGVSLFPLFLRSSASSSSSFSLCFLCSLLLSFFLFAFFPVSLGCFSLCYTCFLRLTIFSPEPRSGHLRFEAVKAPSSHNRRAVAQSMHLLGSETFAIVVVYFVSFFFGCLCFTECPLLLYIWNFVWLFLYFIFSLYVFPLLSALI